MFDSSATFAAFSIRRREPPASCSPAKRLISFLRA
jgi:hypothetical protein